RRADALLRGGQRAEAHALLDSIAAAAPGYLPITVLRERDALVHQDWEALARAYMAAGAAAELGTAFGQKGAAGAAPDPAWAAVFYVWAGDLFAAQVGNDGEARAAYEKALELRPRYAPAVTALCDLYERMP